MFAIKTDDIYLKGSSFDSIEEAIRVKKLLKHENKDSEYSIVSSTHENNIIQCGGTTPPIPYYNRYQIVEKIPGEILAITDSHNTAMNLSTINVISSRLNIESYTKKDTKGFIFQLKSIDNVHTVYSSNHNLLQELCNMDNKRFLSRDIKLNE